ncbi:MAG: hypothetical protein RR063_02065, partial [Anaerovoracaceae bacterium]
MELAWQRTCQLGVEVLGWLAQKPCQVMLAEALDFAGIEVLGFAKAMPTNEKSEGKSPKWHKPC